MFAVMYLIHASLWIIIAPVTLAVSAGGIGFVSLTILMAEESYAGPATTMMLRQSGFSLGLAGGGAVGGLALTVGGYELLGIGILTFAVASSAVIYRRALGTASLLSEPEIAVISGPPAAISSAETES
jgi:predicted MFS family arabinose efflux permease